VSTAGDSVKAATEAWRALLGDEHVRTDEATLQRAQTATFPTDQRVLAVLYPADRGQVQECLRIANRFAVPLYPLSSGRNWGYGSAVPVLDGSVILNLSRMNRIVDFSEELAHVTVEPGVTQGQLHEYLKARGSRLWMDATGASTACSLVGNTAERGFGHTPYGDHFANVCGLEVVLPTGECIHTGFGRFGNATAAPVYRWGVGPFLDGLFTQSNLGIITRMTVWLMPAPECFQAFYCSIEEDGQLEGLVDTLRRLRLDGTIRSAVHIGNDYKILSSIQAYPWAEAGGQTPLPPALLRRLAKSWDFGVWNGSGGLYGTREQVAVARRRIKAALRGRVKRVRFLDDRLLRLAELLQRPYRWATGINLPEMLKIIRPVFGIMKGIPTEEMIRSTYWRKKGAIPGDTDPDRDGCGLIWCAPIAPATGAHARAMVEIVKQVFEKHRFEPAMSMTLINERSLDNVISIAYDRGEPGEDARALACHEELMGRLVEAGYYPYRLGVRAMGALPAPDDDYLTFFRRLKLALDPGNVLAPGRYER
jgi:4-cresol dehydrogenase (hydroxylating)